LAAQQAREAAVSTLALAYGVGAEPRVKTDLCVEPPEAVEALLAVERFDGPIWDPAAGTRSLANVLIRSGYEVLASDGNDPERLDFLKLAALEHAGRYDIVSNPPFAIADRFALRALAVARGKVALFTRLGCNGWRGSSATASYSRRIRRAECGCSPLGSAWTKAAQEAGCAMAAAA
jgi:hypothetical protein